MTLNNIVTLKSWLEVIPPFDSLHTSSYCRSSATLVLSCTISQMKRYTGRETQLFLPLYSALQLEDTHQNIAITFGVEKLEWCGYLKVYNV